MIPVMVTEKEFAKGRSVFAEDALLQCISVPKDEAAVAQAVRSHNARHVILGVEKYTGPLYDALPAEGVIARFGVGHDGIDKTKATATRLFCVNTPGALTDSVAEWTFALLLAAARNLPTLAWECKQGRWPSGRGQELCEKTLAVIGCGAIGRRVAQIASFGFRMNVVGCETAPVDPREYRTLFGFQSISADFATAVRSADYVTLHLASTAETFHWLNKQRLGRLGPRAWLINTARGAVVDEIALYRALADHRLAGAALDVFENEPYRPLHPDCDLRRLDNVILLPHQGSSTEQANLRMARQCLQNIHDALNHNYANMNLLNPEVLSVSGVSKGGRP